MFNVSLSKNQWEFLKIDSPFRPPPKDTWRARHATRDSSGTWNDEAAINPLVPRV